MKPDPASSKAPWRVYNIGNSQPVELLAYIECIEKALGKTTTKELLPMQPGDVEHTYADVEDLVRDIGYTPRIPIEQGIRQFVSWYRNYYGIGI